MWPHQNIAIVDLAAALAKITDQFLATFELRLRRLVVIEIAHETNAKRDVVQVIAVDMAAVDLPTPAIAYLDLAIAGGCAVADDEMISEPISHPAHMSMVIIEDASVALTGATVVDYDELPAPALHRRVTDLLDD